MNAHKNGIVDWASIDAHFKKLNANNKKKETIKIFKETIKTENK